MGLTEWTSSLDEDGVKREDPKVPREPEDPGCAWAPGEGREPLTVEGGWAVGAAEGVGGKTPEEAASCDRRAGG